MTSTAAILTVGDELMLGDRVDTNGPWLSRELLTNGIETIERRSVHDQVKTIASAIKSLAGICDLLIVTGGLGPTQDDRTREALATALSKELVLNDEAHASMVAWFGRRDAEMPSTNDVQAMIPETASWIPNVHGTAPGLQARIGDCTILCLPGPPNELQPMFQSMKDELFSTLDLGVKVSTCEIHSWGMAESIAGEKIADLMQEDDPSVAILMSCNGITARVTSASTTLVEEVVGEIANRWSPWVYGQDDATLASSVGELLLGRGGTLATAESCTGGLISELVVRVAGASDWFRGGWVVYSDALKVEQLGVDQSMLDAYGAVSSEVATAMCLGAISKSGASCAVSATGISGPTGGSEEKPVGTVYIGCCIDGDVHIRLFRFSGNRESISSRAACTALQLLHLHLCGEDAPVMCWQHGQVTTC